MEVEEHRRVPLRTLCARLRFLLGLFEQEGALQGAWWPGVSNLLLPTACLSSVETNASVADLYDAWVYCSHAAGYDDRQSTLLNDYLAQLAQFHFVWSAYEAIRRQSESGHLLTSKIVGDRMMLVERVPPTQLVLLDRVYLACESMAQRNKRILMPLKMNDEDSVVGKAGLIAAGFRNYIFHGNDAIPTPDDWNDQFPSRLAGDEILSYQAYRLAYFTRLTFHLAQILTHAELRRSHDIELGYVRFLPWGSDCELGVPSRFLLSLSTCWPEEKSLRLSCRALQHLAEGCDVSGEVLKLMMDLVDVAD